MRVFLGAHNIISPLAFNSKENFERISKGESAVSKREFPFSQEGFFCSKIDDKILNESFSKLGKATDYTRLERMAILSIADVLKQSGVDLSKKESLLIFSTTKGNIDVLENAYPSFDKKRAYLAETAERIGNFFHCAITPLVLSNACISGLLAMIIAKRYIESGAYKNIMVCGSDIISEFTTSGFKSFNAISPSRCRPFDAKRNGINLGEAAATILLSSEPISNLIITSGASANDANHISGPSRTGDGLFQALQQTLKGDSSVDFISAHGTATEYNDEMESVAFDRAGLNDVPLHSLKAYYGHTLGAAGILESIISLISLQENKLIASLGYEEQGTSKKINVIEETQDKPLQRILKTASGFGGCNAAAIFEKI
ncbi:MAG: beta-ketoacyl synthase [Bacteroidia bacterium]|nr:beta-ketoacyl synthase [Bacteroidia bacterium]